MRYGFRATLSLTLLTLTLTLLCGCQKAVVLKPDYNRPLPPGENALRMLLDDSQWPDLKGPWEQRQAGLDKAIELSQAWFDKPSSKTFFPLGDVTYDRAQASVYAFAKLMHESQSASEFEQKVHEEFNCYTTVGFDERGTVLFTGYYTPVFKASLTRTPMFKYPLYKKPKDLVIEPLTGKVLGRKVGSGYEPYPARKQIESSNMLAGTELCWVADRLDQYIIQVNGSAKLELSDGSTMYIGYAGNNGHPYTGLGATLVKEGVIAPERLSLASIREHFRGKPQELERYIEMNERYVFFAKYDGANWPAGSLGMQVTPRVSLATDKSVFPRGGVVVIQTWQTPRGGAPSPFNRIMLDQDTGGAIRAAGRADIYFGVGPDAEAEAGGQFAQGRMYYFFLKFDRVLQWHQQMTQQQRKANTLPKPKQPGPFG